jgi:hypothetical protein
MQDFPGVIRNGDTLPDAIKLREPAPGKAGGVNSHRRHLVHDALGEVTEIPELRPLYKWVLGIECHHLSVTIWAERKAVVKRSRAAVCFLDDVVALHPCVLPLVAETALALACYQRIKSNIQREGHLGQ